MVLQLYKMDYSPPVRAVCMTIKALGIEVEYVEVNIPKREQFRDSFLKMNPQHTIPTLNDNGKVIWDSHAINIYLITKYGKDDSLYPKDPHLRGIINQRLHFDTGVLFSVLRKLIRSMKFKGVKSVSQDVENDILEAYDFLEAFLQDASWMSGDKPTLADIQLLTTVTSTNIVVPINADKYPRLTAWVERGKELPYYDVNEPGLRDFKELFETLSA